METQGFFLHFDVTLYLSWKFYSLYMNNHMLNKYILHLTFFLMFDQLPQWEHAFSVLINWIWLSGYLFIIVNYISSLYIVGGFSFFFSYFFFKKPWYVTPFCQRAPKDLIYIRVTKELIVQLSKIIEHIRLEEKAKIPILNKKPLFYRIRAQFKGNSNTQTLKTPFLHFWSFSCEHQIPLNQSHNFCPK